MKNITVFSVLLCLVLSSESMAQTATGGCDSVTVTSTPTYSPNIYFANVSWKQCQIVGQSCCRTITSGQATTPKYYLEQKNGSNWTTIFGPQFNLIFDNLEKGTYRVRMNVPVVAYNICEGGEPIILYNTSGQFIGWWGTWSEDYFTNEVLVGPTDAADNNYHFTEGNPSLGENSMDLDEDVGMDASASTNYDQWFLAICEQSFNNCLRYRSNGWTNGTVGQFDLKGFWQQGGWQFQEWMTYEVQFVVENSKCRNGVEVPPPWNENRQTFVICEAGTGCRSRAGDKVITIGPNPASTFVRLGNFDPAVHRGLVMSFTDLSGRAVKSVPLVSEQVDISGLPDGMYAVNVLRDGHRLFTAKLSANNH